MNLISQDDDLTAGAWAAYDLKSVHYTNTFPETSTVR